MNKSLIKFLVLSLVLSCNSKLKYHSEPDLAKKLTNEGAELISKRIFNSDSLSGLKLNSMAIQKFDSAYHYDTTYSRAQILASECCMYGREFEKCIYWLQKLINTDTSKHDLADHYQMMGYCYVNLGKFENGKANFRKALGIWEKIAPSDKSLITYNLSNISNEIYLEKDSNQKNNLVSKGITPCQYSIEILNYAAAIDTTQHYKEIISERQKKCNSKLLLSSDKSAHDLTQQKTNSKKA